jgi:hypothetical protein
MQVHQLGAARIRDVSDVNSAVGPSCQLPNQIGVDRTEEDITGFCLLSDQRQVFQKPTSFHAAEISA